MEIHKKGEADRTGRALRRQSLHLVIVGCPAAQGVPVVGRWRWVVNTPSLSSGRCQPSSKDDEVKPESSGVVIRAASMNPLPRQPVLKLVS